MYATKISDDDSNRPIKKMRTDTHGDIYPSFQKQRLNIRPGSVVVFVCDPVDKADDAIKHAVQVPGIQAATTGSEDGWVAILIDPETRFRKYSDCFDGPDWKMTKLASEDKTNMVTLSFIERGVCLSSQKHGLRIISDKMMRRINPTEEERTNLPVIASLLGAHGRKIISFRDKEVFILFTYNYLKMLGYYAEEAKDPGRVMGSMPTKPGKIFLMEYKDLFGKATLEDGRIIANPLNYRPSGDVALVVDIDHVMQALGKCTSPKARALADLMARFFSACLAEAAEKMVADMGPEEFEKTVAEPADNALSRSLMENMELKVALAEERTRSTVAIAKAEMKTLLATTEADKKVAVAAAEAKEKVAVAREEVAEAKEKVAVEKHASLLLKMTNKPIVTYHQPDEYVHPRIGCAGLFYKTSPLDKPVMKMRYTEQRDITQRRTLRQSVMTLKSMNRYREKMVAALYGGINVIRTRTLMDKVFPEGNNAPASEVDAVALIEKEFMPSVASSFAAGVVFKDTGKTVCFANDVIIDSLPDADYCRSLLEE
jgi:hypothetical protein